MQVYYDSGRTYSAVRLHPYAPGDPNQSGYVDFKASPELITQVLEDFTPFAGRAAIQTFYRLLRELNGPGSQLETSDCAFRPPSPHSDANSDLALSAYGRLYVLLRDLEFNCSREHIEWCRSRLMSVLNETDPEMTPAQGVVGFTLIKILHTSLSKGTWREEGFECEEDDPGYGQHLMLTYWAYGDTEDETYQNLGRLFENIRTACTSISVEISAPLKGKAGTER